MLLGWTRVPPWLHVTSAVLVALGTMAILGPAQLFFGDQHGLNTLEYQPVKVAAMAAHARGSILRKWRAAEIQAPSHPSTMPVARSTPTSSSGGPCKAK
jgi:cytochrome bd-type quinol oxidase subunit 1